MDLINQGIQHHRASQWDLALQCYEQVLSTEHDNCNVLMLYASLLFQMGDIDQAYIAINKLLTLDHQNPGAHNLAGLIQVNKKNYHEAVNSFKLAIRYSPRQYHYHASLAEAYKSLGQFSSALTEYKHCTKIAPDNAQGFYHCGLLYLRNKEMAKAIESFEQAIILKPDLVSAYEPLARIFFQLTDYPHAISVYQQLLTHSNKKAYVLNNIAIIYQHNDQYTMARQSYVDALTEQPDNANVYLNLASLDLLEHKLDSALYHLNCALLYDAMNPVTYNNLGNTLQRLQRPSEAITAYNKAIELQTDYVDAHLNLAFAYLRQGDFKPGWQQHEWRLSNRVLASHVEKLAHINKHELKGIRILVQTEQGIGDTIQFIRFLPQLKQYGCTLTLEAPINIHSLLSDCHGVDHIIDPDNNKGSDFDFTIPLMSLPYILGTTLNNLPCTTPYLYTSSHKQQQWHEYFDTSKTNIGIAWHGNPRQSYDKERSTTLANFLCLSQVANVNIFSLQYDEESKQLLQNDAYKSITDLGYPWDDTAAITQQLDLVISVDTSVAHLAAAMNVPTWLLLPYHSDWRWMCQRDDSPWYPSMTLMRQREYNDWNELLSRVVSKLETLTMENISD